MSFPFPTNPVDGQQVSYVTPDGTVLTATYHAAKDQWVVSRLTPSPTSVFPVPPVSVTATADRQVITWDANQSNWTAAAVPTPKLTQLQDVDHTADPSLGEGPIWRFAPGGEANAKFNFGTPNAHIKPWDSTVHWESGACVFYEGRLWRSIKDTTNVEPVLDDGKVTIYLRVKGEPTFGIIPVSVGPNDPPAGNIALGSVGSRYGYHLKYTNDTTMEVWKFVVKGLDPATHKPFGVWEGRPWLCMVWRGLVPPPASPPGTVMVWIYGEPGHTHAPVLGQAVWSPLELGHNLATATDVDVRNAASNDLLMYDGTNHKWVHTTLAELKAKLAALP